MGTGVNSQIIATSTFWKFELLSGIILIVIMLPLTYILAKQYDIIGPAIGSLVSISIYNIIRIVFLWKKFRLNPFTVHTIQTILLAAACYFICHFAFREMHSLLGMVVRSSVFLALYASGAIYLKLSPDIQPVLQTLKKRLGIKKD